MRTGRTRVIAAALAACLVAIVLPELADATSTLPAPGTATTIRHLVHASPSINVLPKNLLPPLAEVHLDNPWSIYRTLRWPSCPTVTSCILGATTSKRVVVLFGDSHALMWLPAVEPIVQRDGDKLVLVWSPNCPAASVTYWDWPTRSYATGCDAWRSSTITAIKRLHPHAVLLASESADRWASNKALMTDAEWQVGITKTITLLQSASTKVGVIGDIPTFDLALPDCLAAYPTSVQKCSVPLLNPLVKNRGHQQAEINAAKTTGALYVNTIPWLCTPTWCSPVIGSMVSYINDWHVTATYAHYLSGVFGLAIKPLL